MADYNPAFTCSNDCPVLGGPCVVFYCSENLNDTLMDCYLKFEALHFIVFFSLTSCCSGAISYDAIPYGIIK